MKAKYETNWSASGMPWSIVLSQHCKECTTYFIMHHLHELAYSCVLKQCKGRPKHMCKSAPQRQRGHWAVSMQPNKVSYLVWYSHGILPRHVTPGVGVNPSLHHLDSLLRAHMWFSCISLLTLISPTAWLLSHQLPSWSQIHISPISDTNLTRCWPGFVQFLTMVMTTSNSYQRFSLLLAPLRNYGRHDNLRQYCAKPQSQTTWVNEDLTWSIIPQYGPCWGTWVHEDLTLCIMQASLGQKQLASYQK